MINWIQQESERLFAKLTAVVIVMFGMLTMIAPANAQTYSAEQIGEMWADNAVNAKQKLEGRTFTITGEIQSIDEAGWGHDAKYVVFLRGYGIWSVAYYTDQSVSGFRKGQILTGKCRNFKTNIQFRCND